LAAAAPAGVEATQVAGGLRVVGSAARAKEKTVPRRRGALKGAPTGAIGTRRPPLRPGLQPARGGRKPGLTAVICFLSFPLYGSHTYMHHAVYARGTDIARAPEPEGGAARAGALAARPRAAWRADVGSWRRPLKGDRLSDGDRPRP